MPRALNAWVQEEIERWSFDGLGRCGKGKKTGWKWMLWVVRFVKILSLYHFLAFFRGNIWTIISISEIKISQLNAISFHDFLWSTPGRQPSMAKPRVLAGKREKPWKSVKIASFNLSNGTWFFQFTRCFFWWFVWWSLLVKIGYTQHIYIYIHSWLKNLSRILMVNMSKMPGGWTFPSSILWWCRSRIKLWIDVKVRE